MTKKEAKEVFINRGFVNGIYDGDKWRESVAVISKWLEQEPCEDAISRKADSICDSCTNIGCVFQSGIVRTECVFYMPPHIEPDNCGNYVVQNLTTNNDLVVDAVTPQESVLGKIRTEIEQIETYDGIYIDRAYVLQILDKYKAESEG